MAVCDTLILDHALKAFMKSRGGEDLTRLRLFYTYEKFLLESDHVMETHPLPDYIIREKLLENRELIALAEPVLAELQAILALISDKFLLMLNDSFGVVMSAVNCSDQELSVGAQCSELRDSSYAVACALQRGLVAEVTGYEKLFENAENWHSTSAAICNADNSLAGVLTFVNIDGALPQAAQIISIGAGVVESLLTMRNKPSFTEPKSQAVNDYFNFRELVGDSELMNNQKKYAQRAARSLCTILIEGESGTGKELMARAIHNESRPNKPFIVINCGAIPMELLQSELFGYEEGSFTGSRKGGMPGKFELADGGTLFLDEIGEMPLSMQVSLLRFLEDKTVVRIGGSRSRKVDVRVISATNRNLFREVAMGSFREDLFYRLNVFKMKMPALRDHPQDIPQIAEHTLRSICKNYNKPEIRLEDSALRMLVQSHWAGNVRELKNMLEKAVIIAEDNIITAESLAALFGMLDESTNNFVSSAGGLREIEIAAIGECLRRNDYNITLSARELGITRATLHKKIHNYGLKKGK